MTGDTFLVLLKKYDHEPRMLRYLLRRMDEHRRLVFQSQEARDECRKLYLFLTAELSQLHP